MVQTQTHFIFVTQKLSTDNAKTVFDDGETLTSDASGNPTVVVATSHIGACSSTSRCLLL